MDTENRMDGGNRDDHILDKEPREDEGVTPLVEISTFSSPSRLERALLPFARIVGLFGLGTMIGGGAIQANAQAVNQETLEAFSSNRPSIEDAKGALPSQKPIAEQINEQIISSPEISASLSITDALKSISMTKDEVGQEWQEQGANHYQVPATINVRDETGAITKKFTLVTKSDRVGTVYETHLDTNGQFTENKATTFLDIPVDYPRTLAASFDGKVIAVGGGQDQAQLVLLFEEGRIPVKIDWKSTDGTPFSTAAIRDILPLSEPYSFLINSANHSGVTSMYIATADIATRKGTIKATSVSGSAYNPTLLPMDGSNKRDRVVAEGALGLSRGGLVFYDDISVETGQVQITHLDKAIIDGKEVFLPELHGTGSYKDPKNSHTHFIASSENERQFYNIDVTDGTATTLSYLEFIDNYIKWAQKNNISLGGQFANYQQRSLEIFKTVVEVDDAGQIHVWFGGGIFVSNDTSQRAAAGHFIWGTDPNADPSSLIAFDLATRGSNIRQMGIEKIGQQQVLDMLVNYFDPGIIPLDKNSTPVAGADVKYISKNLGVPAQVYTTDLPLVTKSKTGAW